MPERIPEVGDDGLRRFNCPSCGRLMFRFHPSLTGGPVEKQCPRQSCKRLVSVRFGGAVPELEVLS